MPAPEEYEAPEPMTVVEAKVLVAHCSHCGSGVTGRAFRVKKQVLCSYLCVMQYSGGLATIVPRR